jgi:hypothetical protein
MRRSLLAAASILIGTCGSYAAEIGGAYTVEGTNFDGSPYRGTAEITVTSDTTCSIVWATGKTSSEGFCMLKGDAFAAGYVLGDNIGLIIYNVDEDGTLDGAWTIAGKNGSGTEVLTPVE